MIPTDNNNQNTLITIGKNMFILSFIFCLAIPMGSLSQGPEIQNEVKNNLTSTENTKERIDWLLERSLDLAYSNPQKSLENSREALELAKKLELPESIINAKHRIASVLINFGEYPEAWEIINKAIDISKKIGTKDLLAGSWRQMGILYDMQGDITNALQYYHDALSLYEEINDIAGMAKCYNNIGVMNYELEKYEGAIKFYKRSLNYAIKENNQRSISISYCNIGNAYEKLKEYDKALDYLEKASEIDKSINDLEGMAATIHNIGLVYMRKGNLDKALTHFKQSLVICEELEDLYRIVTRHTAISELYNKKGEYQNAITHAKTGLEVSKKIESIGQQPMLLNQLIEAYRQTGNYYDAYRVQSRYINVKDSLFDIEKAKEVSKIQTIYQVEQKQQELDKTKILAAKDRITRNAFVAAFVISIILIIFIVLAYRNKVITNRRINEQNTALEQAYDEIKSQKEEIFTQHEIVLKHKDFIENQKNNIESSIRYAERIQNALLPSDNLCKRVLGDHFVLFKPKEVVSGDFYWTTKIKNLAVFAVADCTGHGVPGAFMSMLGLSFLKEIVSKKEITSPDKILNTLRDYIIEALQQKGRYGDQNEGMDIALCVLNTDNKKLQFAGAKNPLIIIKNNEKLQVIEPDKQPIAIHKKMKPFTGQQIQMQKGDAIYLASDGFQDQFGGPEHKRFMRRNFRKLLTKISVKPLNEQKQILLNTFAEWKGDNDQIDDITILSIKI